MAIKIYFDIDGVLADVRQATQAFTNRTELARPWQTLTKEQQQAKQAVWRTIEKTPNFWRNLPEISNISALLTVALGITARKNLFVLSKVAAAENFVGGGVYCSQIAFDKKLWIQEHFQEYFPPENVLIAFVSKEKLVNPGKDDILIDDWQTNTDAWNTAGGHGILFMSPQQTINELLDFIQNSMD